MIPNEIAFISALAKMKPKAAWRPGRPAGAAGSLIDSPLRRP